MASMQDGTPVGLSFEVYAADEPNAIHSAYESAKIAGQSVSETLYVEQLEAGKWEVVLQEVIDPLWPKGGRPMCSRCHAKPVYMAGQCGTCWRRPV